MGNAKYNAWTQLFILCHFVAFKKLNIYTIHVHIMGQTLKGYEGRENPSHIWNYAPTLRFCSLSLHKSNPFPGQRNLSELHTDFLKISFLKLWNNTGKIHITVHHHNNEIRATNKVCTRSFKILTSQTNNM